MANYQEEYFGTEFINLNANLHPYFFGSEHCKPGHFNGPSLRDHYLVHYIHSGKGIFQCEGRTYKLKKGQGFLICPGTITYYKADYTDPWSYSWLAFNGLKAGEYLSQAKLTNKSPVFTYIKSNLIEDFFSQMLEASKLEKSREIRLISLVYFFLSLLIENSDSPNTVNKKGKDLYMKKAMEFVAMNYSRKISVEDMAEYAGISRKYMSSIFNNVINISPQEYLISYRIEKACELMSKQELSIGDISRSVGYDDQLLFSRIFKKFKRVCPKEYRRNYSTPLR